MDTSTAVLLQGLVKKEGRSLLQYVSESYPWTPRKSHEAVSAIIAMAHEERDAAASLVRHLVSHRVQPPYLGAYPMSFTTINYMSVDFLVPQLVEFEKKRIAELEKDVLATSDEEAKHLLQHLLQMKRQHLTTLTSLAATQKPAA